MKRRDLVTAMCRETTMEQEGRDAGDASISQGTLKIASKPPEARGEVWTRFFPTALFPTGIRPTDTLDVDFWPSGLCDDQCLLSLLPSL